MPEGDSIHKIAAAMAPRAVGRQVRALGTRERGVVASLAGETVESVEALGKHLLVAIGARAVARVHLGMKGRWHTYRADEPWQRSRQRAVLWLEVDSPLAAPAVFVCFDAPQVELLTRGALATHPQLSQLGPDLLAPELDVQLVLQRLRAPRHTGRAIGDALLDQRIAAGIGNVYKSELCFLEGVHPEQTVSELADARATALYARARLLMQRNLGPWKRTTTVDRSAGEALRPGQPRLWVYDRAGRPCLRCDEPIAQRQQRSDSGATVRTTYWCPRCQPRSRDGDDAGPRGDDAGAGECARDQQ